MSNGPDLPGPRRASLRLDPHPVNAQAARRFVRRQLENWGYGTLAPEAELCASELVTNAVLHAGSPIELLITLGPRRLRVEVHDRSPQPALGPAQLVRIAEEPYPPVAPVVRHADGEATTGRGLQIVATIASSVGEDVGDDGKTVWFELDHPARRGSDHATVVQTGSPGAGATGPRRVELLNVPVGLAAASEDHLDGLLRELLLLPGDHQGDVAGQVVDAIISLRNRHPGLQTLRDIVRLAAARGRDRVDVRLQLADDVAAGLDRLFDRVARIEVAAGPDALLTPPAPPDVWELRRWYVSELSAQLREYRPPHRCPLGD